MATEIRRFPLQRFSIPAPIDRLSPAKIRNKELQWIHYADTEKDPLMLEIRTRMSPIPRASGSRASGAVYAGYSHHGVVSGADRSGDQCVVKVMCGSVCYKELSIDEYRHAYEAQRNSRTQDRPHEHESRYGDEHEWQGEALPVVETIKCTIKPPALAIKLLAPLEQLSGRRSVYKSAEDYTYDRFQLRFSSENDVNTFLTTIYAHFPMVDPSFRNHHTQQSEPPAESIAVSQGTQIYLPGDSAWRINRRCYPVREHGPESPMKRRKLNDENVYHEREESEVRGTMPAERMDIRGRDQLQKFSMNRHGSPTMPQPKQTRHLHLQTGRHSPPTQLYASRPPSFDRDGFAKPLLPVYKPLPPAYIDTPTPANRIYHLKEVDPNRTSHQGHFRSPSLSSKRPLVVSDADDPFGGPSHFHTPRYVSSPVQQQEIQESFKLPPLRHDTSPGPVEEESLKTMPTGLTQLEPQGQWNNNLNEGRVETEKVATPQRNVSSRSLRQILASETVSAPKEHDGGALSTNHSGRAQEQKPWPEIYGDPLSTSSRLLVSSVKETSDARISTPEGVHKTSVAAQSIQQNERPQVANASQENTSTPTNVRALEPDKAPLSRVAAPMPPAQEAMTAARETLRTISPPLPSTMSVTAHITQASSLYTLLPGELSHAINSILLEDGFIPFVERLSERYTQLLVAQAHTDEQDHQMSETGGGI